MAISTTILGRVHWISIYTPLEKSPPLLEGLISPIPLSLQEDCEFTEGLDALVLDDPVACPRQATKSILNCGRWT